MGSRQIIGRVIFPAFVLSIGAFALSAPAWRVAAALGLDESLNDPVLAPIAVFLFYPLIAILERLLTHRRDWLHPRGDITTDALHLAITGPATSGFFDTVVRGVVISAAAALAASQATSLWPSSWPAVAQLALAIAVAEFGHYWFHRLSHEQPLIWRLHATHHSAERLYWLNATRFHPVDLLALLTFQTTPLFLLGIGHDAYLSYVLFTVVYGQIQHCNIDAKTGRYVDWLFSTPAIHRWHHSRDPHEGNNNYGAITNLWDHLFGTYFRPTDREFADPVGIAGLPHFPRGYLAQLASPFRWSQVAGR